MTNKRFTGPDQVHKLAEREADALGRNHLAKRQRLGDQLYEEILREIVSGTWLEGAKLPSENQLSRVYGVSRPIVREAIFRLQVDGLVMSRQGSGTFVLHRPSADFFEHAPAGAVAETLRFFELRLAIEGEAAFHAAQRRSSHDLQRITEINTRLQRAVDAGQVGTEIDVELHAAIAQAAHNDLFVKVLVDLNSLFEAGLKLTRNLSLRKQPERQRLVQSEHTAIILAILEGHPDSARTAMRHHIDNARVRLVKGSQDP